MTRKVHLAGAEKDGRRMPKCPGDHWYEETTDVEARVTCSTCLAIIDRQVLAERAADAPKIELDAFEGFSPYRSTYRALINGEHVGFVVYEGAYGRAAWRICTIHIAEKKDAREIGYRLDDDPTKKYPRPLGFATKYRALMATPELFTQNRLKTVATLKAEAEETKRWIARREAEIAADDARQAEETILIRDGLKSLRERGDLSNLEQASVVAMLARLAVAS